MTAPNRIACVIPAGGRGARLGGNVAKPLREIAGRLMIAHVLDRVVGRIDTILVGANDLAAFAGLGLPVVSDRRTARLGPLAAIEAAVLHLEGAGGRPVTHLLSLTGDTPFLPDDVAERLIAKAGDRPVVAAHRGRLQFATALWPVRSLTDLGERLDRGASAIRALLDDTGYATVEFDTSATAPDGDPFFNVNTPDDLTRAQAALARS